MACDVRFDDNQTLITVHGREGLLLPYTKFTKTTTGREEQVDISNSVIYIEIPAANLRKLLVPNPSDEMGLLIKLLREEVESLPKTQSEFVVIDETGEVPNVEWIGKIERVGYTGAPSGN